MILPANIINDFIKGNLFYKVILFLLLIPLSTVNCQLSTDNNFFSPQNRLKFGTYLYNNKDYLRAANEFKEYLKFENNDTVRFRFANSFFKIGRYTEAADNFKSLFFGSPFSEDARLMFYESNFFQNDYETFRELAGKQNYLSYKYEKEIERLKFITYFFDNTILPDENVMLESFPDSAQTQLVKFYLQKKFPKYKSATTAAILSAIIPGGGKIYTGEIGDGITAFITSALTAYLAVTNFQADHKFRGWLFTGLATFFYGGNIYGSAASAQIYNARIRFNFDGEVRFYFEQRNYFLPEINY